MIRTISSLRFVSSSSIHRAKNTIISSNRNCNYSVGRIGDGSFLSSSTRCAIWKCTGNDGGWRTVTSSSNRNSTSSALAKIRSFSSSSSSSSLRSSEQQKKLSLCLYRILYRCIRDDFDDSSPSLQFMMLQPPLDPRQLGHARLLPTSDKHYNNNNNDNDNKKQDDDIMRTEYENEQRWKSILHFFRKQSQSAAMNSYDNDNNEFPEEFLWTSNHDLKYALRQAFMAHNLNDTVVQKRQQKEAIDAIKIWNQQIVMWKQCTTVTVDESYGIRVIATSRCVGTSGGQNGRKKNQQNNHFAYKIRIQSLQPPQKKKDEKLVVQLLGRTWSIKEEPSAVLCPESDNYVLEDEEEAVSITAPNTGAVGHLPVIRPGETFEYMSKCELATTKGSMGGCFHMALVPADTQSAQVGDPVEALEDENIEKFEMPVGPFNLNSQHF
uniref:ApaG domain-containing protein n=1 Tax=Eucampia antarctica TaxID=49252 RepID=A0A7S2VZW8_9STRA|mmetsp:Transcript_14411/g.13931  ORF Transcript_14411/g.13931 Transcript_14411/m.13931 type:complete len:437 (+) Transcript_14411:40-1350(+)